MQYLSRNASLKHRSAVWPRLVSVVAQPTCWLFPGQMGSPIGDPVFGWSVSLSETVAETADCWLWLWSGNSDCRLHSTSQVTPVYWYSCLRHRVWLVAYPPINAIESTPLQRRNGHTNPKYAMTLQKIIMIHKHLQEPIFASSRECSLHSFRTFQFG